jgi:hypothetical protein
MPENQFDKTNTILQIFKPLKLVLCSSCDGVLKIQKEKQAGLQFTSTNYLSLLLTPLRIRWTIPSTATAVGLTIVG